MKLSRNKIAKLLKSGNQSRKNKKAKSLYHFKDDELIITRKKTKTQYAKPRHMNLRLKTLKNKQRGGERKMYVKKNGDRTEEEREFEETDTIPEGWRLKPETTSEPVPVVSTGNVPTGSVPTGSVLEPAVNVVVFTDFDETLTPYQSTFVFSLGTNHKVTPITVDQDLRTKVMTKIKELKKEVPTVDFVIVTSSYDADISRNQEINADNTYSDNPILDKDAKDVFKQIIGYPDGGDREKGGAEGRAKKKLDQITQYINENKLDIKQCLFFDDNQTNVDLIGKYLGIENSIKMEPGKYEGNIDKIIEVTQAKVLKIIGEGTEKVGTEEEIVPTSEEKSTSASVVEDPLAAATVTAPEGKKITVVIDGKSNDFYAATTMKDLIAQEIIKTTAKPNVQVNDGTFITEKNENETIDSFFKKSPTNTFELFSRTSEYKFWHDILYGEYYYLIDVQYIRNIVTYLLSQEDLKDLVMMKPLPKPKTAAANPEDPDLWDETQDVDDMAGGADGVVTSGFFFKSVVENDNDTAYVGFPYPDYVPAKTPSTDDFRKYLTTEKWKIDTKEELEAAAKAAAKAKATTGEKGTAVKEGAVEEEESTEEGAAAAKPKRSLFSKKGEALEAPELLEGGGKITSEIHDKVRKILRIEGINISQSAKWDLASSDNKKIALLEEFITKGLQEYEVIENKIKGKGERKEAALGAIGAEYEEKIRLAEERVAKAASDLLAAQEKTKQIELEIKENDKKRKDKAEENEKKKQQWTSQMNLAETNRKAKEAEFNTAKLAAEQAKAEAEKASTEENTEVAKKALEEAEKARLAAETANSNAVKGQKAAEKEQERLKAEVEEVKNNKLALEEQLKLAKEEEELKIAAKIIADNLAKASIARALEQNAEPAAPQEEFGFDDVSLVNAAGVDNAADDQLVTNENIDLFTPAATTTTADANANNGYLEVDAAVSGNKQVGGINLFRKKNEKELASEQKKEEGKVGEKKDKKIKKLTEELYALRDKIRELILIHEEVIEIAGGTPYVPPAGVKVTFGKIRSSGKVAGTILKADDMKRARDAARDFLNKYLTSDLSQLTDEYEIFQIKYYLNFIAYKFLNGSTTPIVSYLESKNILKKINGYYQRITIGDFSKTFDNKNAVTNSYTKRFLSKLRFTSKIKELNRNATADNLESYKKKLRFITNRFAGYRFQLYNSGAGRDTNEIKKNKLLFELDELIRHGNFLKIYVKRTEQYLSKMRCREIVEAYKLRAGIRLRFNFIPKQEVKVEDPKEVYSLLHSLFTSYKTTLVGNDLDTIYSGIREKKGLQNEDEKILFAFLDNNSNLDTIKNMVASATHKIIDVAEAYYKAVENQRKGLLQGQTALTNQPQVMKAQAMQKAARDIFETANEILAMAGGAPAGTDVTSTSGAAGTGTGTGTGNGTGTSGAVSGAGTGRAVGTSGAVGTGTLGALGAASTFLPNSNPLVDNLLSNTNSYNVLGIDKIDPLGNPLGLNAKYAINNTGDLTPGKIANATLFNKYDTGYNTAVAKDLISGQGLASSLSNPISNFTSFFGGGAASGDITGLTAEITANIQIINDSKPDSKNWRLESALREVIVANNNITTKADDYAKEDKIKEFNTAAVELLKKANNLLVIIVGQGKGLGKGQGQGFLQKLGALAAPGAFAAPGAAIDTAALAALKNQVDILQAKVNEKEKQAALEKERADVASIQAIMNGEDALSHKIKFLVDIPKWQQFKVIGSTENTFEEFAQANQADITRLQLAKDVQQIVDMKNDAEIEKNKLKEILDKARAELEILKKNPTDEAQITVVKQFGTQIENLLNQVKDDEKARNKKAEEIKQNAATITASTNTATDDTVEINNIEAAIDVYRKLPKEPTPEQKAEAIKKVNEVLQNATSTSQAVKDKKEEATKLISGDTNPGKIIGESSDVGVPTVENKGVKPVLKTGDVTGVKTGVPTVLPTGVKKDEPPDVPTGDITSVKTGENKGVSTGENKGVSTGENKGVSTGENTVLPPVESTDLPLSENKGALKVVEQGDQPIVEPNVQAVKSTNAPPVVEPIVETNGGKKKKGGKRHKHTKKNRGRRIKIGGGEKEEAALAAAKEALAAAEKALAANPNDDTLKKAVDEAQKAVDEAQKTVDEAQQAVGTTPSDVVGEPPSIQDANNALNQETVAIDNAASDATNVLNEIRELTAENREEVTSTGATVDAGVTSTEPTGNVPKEVKPTEDASIVVTPPGDTNKEPSGVTNAPTPPGDKDVTPTGNAVDANAPPVDANAPPGDTNAPAPAPAQAQAPAEKEKTTGGSKRNKKGKKSKRRKTRKGKKSRKH